jgi:hypothetical protein
MPEVAMKTIAIVLLVVALVLPLRADEVLQNGDFSDGITHWHGDARSPADFATDNPLGSADPFTSKGMIIPLKHTAWVKVMQDFKATSQNSTLTITYMSSTDLALSTRDEDYALFPLCLDLTIKSKPIKPNQWAAGVYVNGGTMEKGYASELSLFPPPSAPTKPETVKMSLKGLNPGDAYTAILAFPPGTGTIVVLNVSMSGS